MHASVFAWVEKVVGRYGLAGKSVLDVGSLDVNGSVRPLFTGPFTGVDMREGPGVDKVALAADLPFPDESFEVVTSTEMLEHDLTFWLSLAEMERVLAPDGWLIISARGNGYPQHDYPGDYYRFMPSSFEYLMIGLGLHVVEVRPDETANPGVFGLGHKVGHL